jgi:hypothetical protein
MDTKTPFMLLIVLLTLVCEPNVAAQKRKGGKA